MKLNINLSIRTKVFALISVIVVLFISSFFYLQLSEEKKIDLLIKERERENELSLQKTVISVGKSLELFAYDYSYWDEMLNFTRTMDLVWAANNIDASFESFNVNAAFVYSKNLDLIYSVTNFQNAGLIDVVPINKIVERAAPHKYFLHYFSSQMGIICEIRLAPIQPSDDLKRETEPSGFFVVMRILSDEYLSELSAQTSSTVKFETLSSEVSELVENDKFNITSSITLNTWDGKPLVKLVSNSQFTLLKKSFELFNQQMIVFVSFAALVLLIVTFFLIKNVSLPLRTISRSLRDENPGLLLKYSNKQDEFGKLSNLISQFFNQKQFLIEEIKQRKEIESSLQVSEEKYRKIFENIQDIFYQTDTNGIITSISPSIERYSEYKPEELLGRNIRDFYKEPNQRSNMLVEIQKHGEVADYELQLVTKSGKIVHCSLNSHFIKDLNGNVIGVEGLARDITERKVNEEKIFKLSQAIEQSPVSVVITNVQGNVEYVNPKFTSLSGYTFEELIGKNAGIIKSGITPGSIYENLWDTITAGNVWNGELQNRKKNGELYWENIVISPIKSPDGIVTNYIGIKEDITEKKKIIAELISAKDKAEELNRLKSSFLANMSHELRTPLIGILGFSEILHSEIKEPEWNSMIDRIHQGGKRLLETLNLILDLSKHESRNAEVKYEILNINETVKECLNLLNPIAAKKEIYLQYIYHPDNLISMMDRKLFQSIVNNLVGNAIKYTRNGGVQVDVFLQTEDGLTNIVLKVSDTGIGIAEKDLNIIFEEFRQVSEGLNRQYEGTGLGLAITKRFVEKLNGKIYVSSTPGEGSEFTVVLPYRIPDSSEPAVNPIMITNKPDIKPQNTDKRILFVDDDNVSRDLIRIFLNEKYVLDTAYNCDSARKLISLNRYSLLLLDINLGQGENGIDLLNEFRSVESNKNIPVVAVTAYAMEYDREKFISKGFDDYLAKPFLKSEFFDLINRIFRN